MSRVEAGRRLTVEEAWRKRRWRVEVRISQEWRLRGGWQLRKLRGGGEGEEWRCRIGQEWRLGGGWQLRKLGGGEEGEEWRCRIGQEWRLGGDGKWKKLGGEGEGEEWRPQLWYMSEARWLRLWELPLYRTAKKESTAKCFQHWTQHSVETQDWIESWLCGGSWWNTIFTVDHLDFE